MLNRLFVILLALLVVSLSGGVPITKHYCGGQAVSLTNPKSCCASNKQTCKKNCCSSELVNVLQLEDSYVVSASVNVNAIAFLGFVMPKSFELLWFLPSSVEYVNTQSPPPTLLSRRLSILQSYLC